MLLSPAQKNYLWASLRTFEESLRMARHILSDGSEKGVLYDRNLNLSPEEINLASIKINQALEAISEIAVQFELKNRNEDLNQTLLSRMTVSWADLIDARSDRLKNYGVVNPVVPEILDPATERLAQMALELSQIFKGRLNEEGF